MPALRRPTLVLLASAIVLSGCAQPTVTTPTSSSPGATSAPSLTPAPSAPSTPLASPSPSAAPQLLPDGTAEQNLDYVRSVLQAYQAAHGRGASTSALVDALAAAGFPRSSIEATPDTTPNGYRATSIDIGIRFDGACLLGSVLDSGWSAVVAPMLSAGTCLVGDYLQG